MKAKLITAGLGNVISEVVEEFIEIENPETKVKEQKSLGFFPRRKLNPDYNPEQKYVCCSDRPEWEINGLLGKLYATDDGSCVVGGYATTGENGIATASAEKTNIRVMKRITDSIVLVFMK